ncbi:MAG TPA: hypothetical protein VFT80_00100, partial [Actinomycetota bacterium]|nr:hypothetical protein [Actinomycetota bacterium]
MTRYKTPQRRPVPRTPAPSRAPRGPKGPDRAKAIRAWTWFGLGAVAFLVVLWLGTKLLGGGDDGGLTAVTGSTGPTGAQVVDFAEPPPPGT